MRENVVINWLLVTASTYVRQSIARSLKDGFDLDALTRVS
jgi:hypothetical protein